MAKTKKPLLNEGTVRRMMKLAEIDSLSDQFIGQTYLPEQEGIEDEEAEVGVEAPEIEPEPEEEIPEEDPEAEGEVTITDEEAQDIINLADKLRDAVGEPEADLEEPEGLEDEFPPVEDEGEAVEEEPGIRYEGVDEDEGLYEAALQGLNIDVVDDQKQAALQEVKKRIYKRVVNRLLKENKK